MACQNAVNFTKMSMERIGRKHTVGLNPMVLKIRRHVIDSPHERNKKLCKFTKQFRKLIC